MCSVNVADFLRRDGGEKFVELAFAEIAQRGLRIGGEGVEVGGER